MCFITDWMPLAPFMDEEIFSREVIVKEELNDITEETCLEIKEEPIDYAVKEKDEVSDVKVKHNCRFFPNLHDLRHEANAKVLCNFVQGHNDLLNVPFVAEDCGNKCLSDGDQAIHKESLEDAQLKVKATLSRFVCEVCGKKFSHKSNINIHMRVHTKEKPYSCDICKKAFSQISDLTRHMRVHTKEKPYSCDICDKAFTQKSDLGKHMRVHTKEKPYNCEICKKAFSQINDLTRHMRVHTKEKPYSCEICDKAFTQKSDLAKHMRVHTKEKPYSCEICNKAISQKSNLVSHMRIHT
ncbi:zinc finger protein 480-like [Penaeus chinensis]|uniref:zinc finger protein 480-like n=1 Tax=Penaeus chinensis TaxID=139456 RepID=UPI001FB85928|nr:zinc finger protein 480-like [Penaeus chinensis]